MFRIELTVWPFVLVMLISMVVTFLTVSVRSYITARRDPVSALKYE